MHKLTIALMLLSLSVSAPANEETDLRRSVEQLRTAVGRWNVITEFLNGDGSVARTVDGSYEFEWVVEDRVVAGKNAVPELGMASGILFYINEAEHKIEMVSVGADGKLWIMTGPLGGETRHTQTYPTEDGGEAQLRFTRYNVAPDRFESRMEITRDGGETWHPANHQLFTRAGADNG